MHLSIKLFQSGSAKELGTCLDKRNPSNEGTIVTTDALRGNKTRRPGECSNKRLRRVRSRRHGDHVRLGVTYGSWILRTIECSTLRVVIACTSQGAPVHCNLAGL